MKRLTVVLAALTAAALIAACGSDDEPSSTREILRPELPATTTTRTTAPKPRKTKTENSQSTPPPYDGPVVKIRIRNGLCTPDSAVAPSGQDFQLQVRSTDREYELAFDSKRTIKVPAHGYGTLVLSGRSSDQPVLQIAGEPCAVIRVG